MSDKRNSEVANIVEKNAGLLCYCMLCMVCL